MTVSELYNRLLFDDYIEIYQYNSDRIYWYGKIQNMLFTYYECIVDKIIPCIILNRYIGLRIVIK